MYSASCSNLNPPSLVLVLVLILRHHVFPTISQQIYIDNVPAYSSLTACAQYPVSSIVRAQLSGCGDNGALTSYSCFCYASSAAFASLISTAVVENCTQATPTPQLEASSAVKVFSSYCQLGAELGYPNPTATSISVPATRTSVTATKSSVNNDTAQSGGGLSAGGGVCIGIVIGLFCAGMTFVLIILGQRSKKRKERARMTAKEGKHGQYYKSKSELARPSFPADWTSDDIMKVELPSRKEDPLAELSARVRPSPGYELP